MKITKNGDLKISKEELIDECAEVVDEYLGDGSIFGSLVGALFASLVFRLFDEQGE